MKTNFIIVTIAAIIFFIFDIFAIYQRDESYKIQAEYKKLLIEFKHARYVIDPVTGKSDFQIDKPAQ